MIGVTMFPAFLKRGEDSTVDDYVEAMEHVISVAGEDHVAFGTDFTQGHGQAFFDWITNDKGNARSLIKFSPMSNPKGRGNHRAAPQPPPPPWSAPPGRRAASAR